MKEPTTPEETLALSKLRRNDPQAYLKVVNEWILFDPFVDNLKIVPRIGSQKIVEHFHLFCGRRFFHYFPSPRHHRA
jgi:hypothetical protein